MIVEIKFEIANEGPYSVAPFLLIIVFPAFLKGEIEEVYDVSLGVPVVLSKKGIAMVVPIHMSDYEKNKFHEACRIVKETTDEVIQALDDDW